MYGTEVELECRCTASHRSCLLPTATPAVHETAMLCGVQYTHQFCPGRIPNGHRCCCLFRLLLQADEVCLVLLDLHGQWLALLSGQAVGLHVHALNLLIRSKSMYIRPSTNNPSGQMLPSAFKQVPATYHILRCPQVCLNLLYFASPSICIRGGGGRCTQCYCLGPRILCTSRGI